MLVTRGVAMALKTVWTLLLLIALSVPGGGPARAAAGSDGQILALDINGAIGPATEDYIERAFATADREPTALILIRMDTPGGLDSAMRNIIKHITRSPVPVATYVAPSGARAASAGTYILYASHIAAMAPGTNLGAATPVQIGGSPFLPESGDKDHVPSQDGPDAERSAGSATAPPGDAMTHKLINDAVAYIRGLAGLHGRNADWAEQAVREAASLPAKEALKLNVIDILATDSADLFRQLDGREVRVLGAVRTLHTQGLPLRALVPDWRNRLLAVITNPNVAYILMLIGIYGLIFEFINPGAVVPGTVGAIALLMALYAFQLLPINYAGMALILLGVALMVAEAFQPSFGILGIGGVLAFVLGSIILMDTQAPGFGIDIAVILGFAAVNALVFIFVIGMALRARRRPVVSGRDQLFGMEGVALTDFNGEGSVRIHSEIWQARTTRPVRRGQRVRVTDVQGLTLSVEPAVMATQENPP